MTENSGAYLAVLSSRARSRTECISREEARILAAEQHNDNGHWGRDAIKLALLDRIHSTRLDETIVEVIRIVRSVRTSEVRTCISLLNPITRRHPFELLVGDYLSLPTGKGGYHIRWPIPRHVLTACMGLQIQDSGYCKNNNGCSFEHLSQFYRTRNVHGPTAGSTSITTMLGHSVKTGPPPITSLLHTHHGLTA